MPLVAKVNTQETAQLGDLIEFMVDHKIDTTSHDDMLATSELLRKVSNDKKLVADFALRNLKGRNNFDASKVSYGPQTIMLHHDRSQNFYIRANFWPSENDHIFRASKSRSFFYYVPHDHNFNFMTVGHLGPGYRSNYYEYDYTAVDGYPGEKVDLKFVENTALEEGKVMLYRAFTDVHDQRPGEAMSMSINIMESTLRGSFMDQYQFDIENGCISELVNRVPAQALMSIVAMSDDENGEDFLREVSRTHQSGRVRCLALGALASVQDGVEGALDVYRAGNANDQNQVRGFCRTRLTALEELVD
ncbi:hypothetical protein [Qipengyuania sp. 483]